MNRQDVLEWCRQQYGTEPDYPWYDENAVLRHADTGKWYGVVLRVKRSKLGLSGDGLVDVLNMKCDPLLIGSLRRNPGYFPAYHMNKDSWVSILLDGPVPDEEIRELIRFSFQLTQRKRRNRETV
ncbi:MAG: MmcQ/YjbR family DNA-binding protein [Faecalibacterium sp.]